MFNFNIQPSAIKKVNGIEVNVFQAPLQKNSLSVTRKHVMLENYSVAAQSTDYTFINAPFTVEY
ncbi:MAG: hypothetical protein WC380_00110 [Pedobacter sp.]